MKTNHSSSEDTLDDGNWKESFDLLLNKRSILRELRVIKSNVRISFNNDSSVEASRNHISGVDNISNLNKYPKSFSTPQFVNKSYGPFDCTLSPISSWQLTHFNQQDDWSSNRDKSLLYEKEKYWNQNPTPKSTKCAKNRSFDKQQGCLPSFGDLAMVQTNCSNTEFKKGELFKSKALTEGFNFSVVLPPGKWRKSLTIWRKLNPHQPQSSNNDSKEKKYQQQTTILEHPESRHPCPSTTKSQKELLKICKQKEVLPFSLVYSDYVLRNCRKIGEGTYGEVFLNSSEDGETVIKIIPIEGNTDVNGETQKGFEEILPEVLITQELSNLRECMAFMSTGFVFLKKVHCIMGKYPSSLIELWDLFKQNYGSENEHPRMFQDNQLYVALETEYGGTDLDKYVFRNSEQAYAVFLQATTSLAVAETHLQFEHRDLHSGNILIKPTNDKSIDYTFDCKKKTIPTSGVKVTIIDYTLSRILLNNFCYYNDLSKDEELFCAKGDYQYDIYRLMKKKLRNNWKTHEPQTNVMWLHYILTKLTGDVKYKYKRSKQHLIYMDRMKKLQNTIMNYTSVYDFFNEISK